MKLLDRLKLISTPVQITQSEDGTTWAKWYKGKLYILKQDTKVTCQTCRGKGRYGYGVTLGDVGECPSCGGEGRREVNTIDWGDKTIFHYYGEGRPTPTNGDKK